MVATFWAMSGDDRICTAAARSVFETAGRLAALAGLVTGGAIIYFTGEAPVGPESQYVLDAVNQVLNRRLTERLREQLGGTYSPSVSATLSRLPVEHYEIAVAFGSSADRADELSDAVFETVRDLIKTGPTEQELHDVAEQQKRARETGLRQNGYWAGMLSTYAQAGWDLSAIAASDPPGGGSALTAAVVQQAARRYFDLANYARFTLVPEKQKAQLQLQSTSVRAREGQGDRSP